MIKIGINGFGRIGRLILRALLENYSKKILLTIDDGFSSFYKNAWPILKKGAIKSHQLLFALYP